MAENLKKTILLDDTEYNINAVFSDTAEKVQASLTLKASNTDGKTTTNTIFNGKDAKEINYVAADGGKFTGPVYIDSPVNTELKNESIVNYEFISDRLARLTGAPVYTWGSNGDCRLRSLLNEENEAYKLNVITGTSQDFDTFKKLIGEGSAGLKFSLHNIVNNDYTNAWCSVSGVDTTYDKNVVIPYKYTYTTQNGTKIKLPVTSIDASAFKGKAIETLIMADSITSMGVGGSIFSGCTSLRKVILSNNLEYIEAATFQGCTALSEIVIPESATEGGGIKKIRTSAFSGCTNLKTVTIPTSVTEIGDYTFAGCTITYVRYCGTREDWTKISISENSNLPEPSVYDYTYEIESNFSTIVSDPFIYISRDVSSDGPNIDTSSANDVFIKLPTEDNIIKISRGATRLDSQNNTTDFGSVQKYYTYEALAEIIARINKRLDGLGVKVTTTNLSTLPTLDSVNSMVPETIEEVFNPKEVPTVQELQAQLEQITGITREFNKDTDNIIYKKGDEEFTELAGKDGIISTPISVERAIADDDSKVIKQSYYRTGSVVPHSAGSTDISAKVNTILVVNSVPTEETLGEIGDIRIVIRTNLED